MRTLLSAVLLAAFLLVPTSQAAVTLKSAVNGASYQNASLPNGKLAQGVLFIAFGEGMGPAQIVRAGSFPLPDDLSGTSISVTVGSTTVKCIILYTTATQVASILPSNTPAGDGTMIATYKGTDSAPLNVTVVAHNFGIFAVNQGGNGPGVFTDPVTNAANSLINAANPDNLLDIWGTGIGAASGTDGAGPLPGDMTNLNVQAFVGGKEAQILYRGRSGCCAGVDQVRIKIPAVSGCYVPVYLVVEGVVSNFISMSAVASGKTCSDPGGFSAEELQSIAARGGYKTATVTAFRIRSRAAQNPETRSDTLGAGFNNVSLQALLASRGNPALNTCWVVQFPTATPPAPEYLDAGKISASGPVGPYDLVTPQGYVGLYTLTFYPGYPVATPGVIGDGTLLKPGTYTFTGAGGSKVGPFTVSLDAPFTFEWTNRDSITAIDRSQPLPVAWTGGTPGGYVSIQGQSSVVAGVGAAFSCWVDAALGSFTVPASILSALPASYLDSHGKPQGALTVVESVNGQTFKPDGIDYGIAQFFDGFDHGVIAYQ